MSAARFAQAAVSNLLVFLILATPSAAAAQDLTPAEIENSKYQFTGVVNSNAVYVRSGPSENDYPTAKLDKGADITVVGIRYEWLKVVPPEGSFCYVAKAFVDRRGDGNSGRVTSTLNVRVGSQLNELKAKIASKLEPGADVEIIGEEQEYFKIKPPAGVYFYVNKQFVDPVRAINLAEAEPQKQDSSAPPAPANTEQPEISMTTQPPFPSDGEIPEPGTAVPAETPNDNGTEPAPITPPAVAQTDPAIPATQPTADAEIEFERLEKEYAEASLKPLDEQPVSSLLEEYQKLAAGGNGLPESLRRIAEFKADVLKSRLEVQQQFAETRKHQDEMRQKQMALDAEREELEQRVKDTDFAFYTAVGTLRPSSLQAGQETLYRLTDPANGRTVVYVRTNDTKIAALIGQFIGIKGEVQVDAQLNVRVVSPTDFEPVNPAKVGQTIAAQIVPPSLLPSGTARTE